MKSKFIKIQNIADMNDFIQKAISVDGDVLGRKGKYVIDCKSIMGVISIDVSTGITVEYPETAMDFEEYISKFE